jgi:hypothetical protein
MKLNKILIDSVSRHPSFHQSQKQLKKLVTLDEEDLKHWKGRISFGESQCWSLNEYMRILLGCRCGRQWVHRGGACLDNSGSKLLQVLVLELHSKARNATIGLAHFFYSLHLPSNFFTKPTALY